MEQMFSYHFYRSDREDAKRHADVALTHTYIERLERIAQAAYAVWKVFPHGDDPGLTVCANTLYDALETVNFLDASL